MVMSLRTFLCHAFVVLLLTTVSLAAVPENDNLIKPHHVSVTTKGVTTNGKGGVAGANSKTSTTFECVAEDTECTKDRLGYEAIGHLHRLIDDDHNGNVDQSESDEFLRDELQYTDGFERHSLFHNNDKLISVDDLWRAWKYSAVYNWTVDEVVDWLQNEVDLPQYSSIFLDNVVNGPYLPRLASSNTFISTILGIKNPVHKQKLTLKAMDTVLFGPPPKRHNYFKDLALMASLIFALGGCLFGWFYHRCSKAQVSKMMVNLDALQKAEDALMDMQRKLEDAEKKQISAVQQPTSDFQNGSGLPGSGLGEGNQEGTEHIREELAATLLALQQAETQLEHSWAPPGQLQAWLQLTHELEQLHYNAKRQAAERQFQAAKESCDKIKRRNRAIFGSLRMAHSNSLDEIDQRILDAKMALEEVKQDLQERLQRWHTIERLCGFPIISNPGLPTLHQLLYGSKEGAGGSRMTPGITASSSVEETEEDKRSAGYPSLPSLPSKSFLHQRTMMGSTGSLSQASRIGVGAGVAHPPSQSHLITHRSSHDFDSPALTSHTFTGHDSAHHSEHLQDHTAALTHGPPLSLPAANSDRARSFSLTPSMTSSVHSTNPLSQPQAYHAYATVTGVPMGQTMSGHHVPPVTRSSAVDSSDDNLSQATVDSLTPSHHSEARHLNNNNRLDANSHTDNDGAILTPRLQKKPSMRKKMMNIFKKGSQKKSS